MISLRFNGMGFSRRNEFGRYGHVGNDPPLSRERRPRRAGRSEYARRCCESDAILDSRRKRSRVGFSRRRHLRLSGRRESDEGHWRGSAALAATISVAPAPKFAVTTYHYDNLRTGWNDDEPTLTYKNVKSGSFGLLQAVTLDDQVDAQPLVVPDETITRGSQQGQHDVVYVATENDTIYAIDASSGAILFDQSLGNPVPTPLGCNNNGPTWESPERR